LRCVGHIAHNCTLSGVGIDEVKEDNRGNLPRANNGALRRLPRCNEPRTRTLANGREIKWCSKCGELGNRLRADHSAEVDTNVAKEEGQDIPNDSQPIEQQVEYHQDEDFRVHLLD